MENPVFPPVPESRAERYKWIDRMVAAGLKVKRACEMAGVPEISYYKIHRAKKQEPPGSGGAQGMASSNDGATLPQDLPDAEGQPRLP